MKRAINLLLVFCLISVFSVSSMAKENKPKSGKSDANEPNVPRERILTKYFKLPLVIGEKYRLGGDNKLVCIEKADSGGFIGKLTVSEKTINVWCRGFGSSRPGSETKYDRTLTVSGLDTYNGVQLYVIQPFKPSK